MNKNNEIDWSKYIAAVWRSNSKFLKPIKDIDIIDFDFLIGIDKQKEQLSLNTELFLSGKEANHALLWGARGMGKSALIKGILNKYHKVGLRLIEIPKEDLVYLLDITDELRESDKKFIIFCDDLTFEDGDVGYKALKSILDGTIEAPPKNILVYATSNRRHLVPERMNDNLDSQVINGEIHMGDVVEETMSLSDRFGLMLSFYSVNQEIYLKMVDNYFSDFQGDFEELHKEAIQYATQKGIRSGRVAKHFYRFYQSILYKSIM
jgi:predicted AAA+ superfamily ATPase